MTSLPPFPEQVEAASVVRAPVVGVVVGLSHAKRLAVQAHDEPVMVSASLTGDRWHAVAYLQPDDIAALPFCEALRCEPDGGATLLAAFPLR